MSVFDQNVCGVGRVFAVADLKNLLFKIGDVEGHDCGTGLVIFVLLFVLVSDIEYCVEDPLGKGGSSQSDTIFLGGDLGGREGVDFEEGDVFGGGGEGVLDILESDDIAAHLQEVVIPNVDHGCRLPNEITSFQIFGFLSL